MDKSDWFFIVAVVIILSAFIGGMGWAVEQDNKFHNACYSAGGIPIERHCIKPGSFIEVK